MRKAAWLGCLMMLAAAGVGGPALADVKAGVDAWQRGEFRKAVEEWRPLALAGDPDAQFNLGQAYKLGRGVALDPVLAQSWFLKAAKQGHQQAADNYGIGLYTAGDNAEAAPWLEKSAARGEPRAQLVLATLLFNGTGVKRDPARAYALMSRASQQGLKSASENLAQMDGAITNADREQGIRLAQQYAAEQDAQRLAQNGDTRRTVASEPGAAPRGYGMAPDTRPPSAEPPARRSAARGRAGDRGPTLFADRPDLAAADRAPPPRRPAAAEPPVKREPAPKHEVAEARRAAPDAATGRFRVQLGAFRSEANAREQWGRVAGALHGAKPSYVRAGAVTRLQAGPFPTRAAAAAACRAAKVPCDVLAS